jgi:N,N'-diacetyllegionaminate synthase
MVVIEGFGEVGPFKKVFVIAEIGKNHNNSMEEAKWLVDRAVEAGVDAVKFQTHVVDDEQRKDIKIISPHFKEMDRYSWVKQNTLPFEWWVELKEYCDKKKTIFFSTPMSVAAAELLEKLDVKLYKVGSADITDLFMLETIAKTGKPIIISSGMNSLEDLEIAMKTIQKYNDKIILLHCVSEYPCPPEHLNLRTITFFQKKFKAPIGLSDHALQLESAYAAVALGAVAVEKHFSRNRDQFGPDHKVSLTPDEMKQMVQGIRIVTSALGSEEKLLQEGEKKFIDVFHKSLVFAADYTKGLAITREMVVTKRPGGGIGAKELPKLLGKKLTVDVKKDDLVDIKNLK